MYVSYVCTISPLGGKGGGEAVAAYKGGWGIEISTCNPHPDVITKKLEIFFHASIHYTSCAYCILPLVGRRHSTTHEDKNGMDVRNKNQRRGVAKTN